MALTAYAGVAISSGARHWWAATENAELRKTVERLQAEMAEHGQESRRETAARAMSGTMQGPAIGTGPRFSIGRKVYRVTSPDGVILKDGDAELLGIRAAGDSILLSASFRDATGKLVGTILGNEWQLNPNEIFQRNYTADGLEVIDQEGKVVLQVIHAGSTVNVEGTFYCRSGRTIQMFYDQLKGASFTIGRRGLRPPIELTPMCRYPSQSHLGECPGFQERRDQIRRSLPEMSCPDGIEGEETWNQAADLCTRSPQWDEEAAADGRHTVYVIEP